MEQSNIDAQAAESTRAAFTIEPAAIASAAAFLAKRVIERRNRVPIASHILICADPAGRVTMTGTDFDHWAAVTLAADVESPGAVCVDAGALADALAKLAKGKAHCVTFAEQDGHRAKVSAGTGGAAFTLRTLPADDFPVAPISEAGAALPGFTVPAARFLADLAALAPCMSANEARYYLQGVSIQARDMAGRDRLLLAATDGSNMALASRPIPAGAESLPDLILHRKAVAMLPHAAKVAGAADALALAYDSTQSSGGMIRLDLGAVTIWTKAIDGTFPDIARPFEVQLAPTGDDAGPMFPELVAGTPLASMAKLEKSAGQPIEWQDAAQGKLGIAPGDDGLLFACMNVIAANEPVKGFTYGYDHDRDRAFTYLRGLAETRNGPIPFAWQSNSLKVIDGQAVGATFGQRDWTKGEYVERHNWETLVVEQVYIEPREVWADGSYSVVMPREDRRALQANVTLEIDGDATVYPLAQSRAGAIHLNAEQVRRIAGESCFETLALTIAGRVVYILQWLFAQDDSRFMTVRADGRCFTGKARGQVQFLTRNQAEAALRGETVGEVIKPEAPAPVMPEICPPEAAESDCAPDMAQGGGEVPDALHGAGIAPLGFFVIDTAAAPVRAVAYHADYGAAMAARDALEPKATYPGNRKTDGKIWRFMVTAETGPNDCRADLRAITLAYHADLAAAEPVTDAYELPAVEPSSEAEQLPGDPLADLAARVAALEARIAALPAESAGDAVNGEKIEVAPSGEVARPRRTAAHERAIRRAWAARIDARRQRAIAADHMRMREQVQEALRASQSDLATAETVIRSMEGRERALKADVERLTADCAEWEALQHRTWGDKVGERLKRRASASRARRLLASTRKVATFQRQRADVLAAQLDKLRADMADPSQPERASDLAQLVRERDQARTALAATDARNRAMKAALDDLAGKFEAMGSRLAVAEAAMRRAPIAV